MKFVAIETTGNDCSVALFSDSNLVEIFETSIPKQHDQLLAQMVSDLLKNNSLMPQEIDVCVVSKGPGSYTGIRIGLSFAIGFSLGANVAIVTIPTLDVIGFKGYTLKNQPDINEIVAIIDAGKFGFYQASYSCKPYFKRITDYSILSNIDLLKLLNDKTKFPIATLDIPIFEIDNYESPFKLSLTAIELGKILLVIKRYTSINSHRRNRAFIYWFFWQIIII